jgi:hypothetical protein
MRTRVKICGITRSADGLAAAGGGGRDRPGVLARARRAALTSVARAKLPTRCRRS